MKLLLWQTELALGFTLVFGGAVVALFGGVPPTHIGLPFTIMGLVAAAAGACLVLAATAIRRHWLLPWVYHLPLFLLAAWVIYVAL